MCIKPSKLFIESREANKHGSTKLGYFLEWMSLIINYNTVKSRRRFRNQKECSLFSEWGAFNKAKTKSILLGQSKRCTQYNKNLFQSSLATSKKRDNIVNWNPLIAINQISDLKHNETNRLRRKESRWENWDIEESLVLVKKWLTKRKSKIFSSLNSTAPSEFRKGSTEFFSSSPSIVFVIYCITLHSLLSCTRCTTMEEAKKIVFAASHCQVVNFPFVDVKWFGDSWETFHHATNKHHHHLLYRSKRMFVCCSERRLFSLVISLCDIFRLIIFPLSA